MDAGPDDRANDRYQWISISEQISDDGIQNLKT